MGAPLFSLRNAQTRFEEGLSLADQGQHEEARVKFVQAYAVLKSTKVLYNLAIAEKKTNHPVDCIKHFRVFLKDPTITPDLRARAEQIIAELSKTTSRVEIAATPGADVRIDGEAVGRAPFDEPVDVAVGHHTVAATLDANNKSAEFDTTAGGLAKVDVSFPGVVGGPTPARPFWTTPRIVGVGMLGAGLIAAGFATGFAVASSKDASQAETLRGSSPDNFCNGVTSPTCTELNNLSSNRVNEANVALGMGIAAGAFLVTGVVLLVMPSPRRKEASMWVVPGLGGASLVGQFRRRHARTTSWSCRRRGQPGDGRLLLGVLRRNADVRQSVRRRNGRHWARRTTRLRSDEGPQGFAGVH